MEVNFDGLRKHLINDYNSLVEKLNHSISDDTIEIDVNYISRQLDGLRSGLITLAFMYQDGEDGFQELDENTYFETFNPIEDE